MSDVNPRYVAYALSQGRTLTQQADYVKKSGHRAGFTLWLQAHVATWAKGEGFEADMSFCKGAPGVVKRTGAEAKAYALARDGAQDRFTTWLQARAQEEYDAMKCTCGHPRGEHYVKESCPACGECTDCHGFESAP